MAPRRSRGAGRFPAKVEPSGSAQADPAELYAALDLGTNSCRMLIAQPKGNQFHVVDSFSKSVQLGLGLERTGRLSRASMSRTLQALKICRSKLDKHGVRRLRLVATEACRRARNGEDFLKNIRRETGLNLDIIKPEEEVPMMWQELVERTYPVSAQPWEKEATWAGKTEGMTSNALAACAKGNMWESYEPTPLTRKYLVDFGYIKP